jgi:hypothetical protein
MKKRKKTGEIASQLFIYILGIIVVGVTLILGYTSVQKVLEQQCEAERVSFASNLASEIEKNKGKGVDRIEQFNLPCKAEAVCFVDRATVDAISAPGSPRFDSDMRDKYPVIISAIEEDENTNVFLRVEGTYESIERFVNSPAPIALPSSEPIRCIEGTPVTLRFQGEGRTVEVSGERNN